jgi:iron-sulfur cluster assembly protein
LIPILEINFFYTKISYKNLNAHGIYFKRYYLCALFRKNKNNKIQHMIKVSDIASKKIIDMMNEDGFDAAQDYVRVGVKSGGCSGLSYELKFDKELTENDKVFEDNNVKIAVEKKSFLYLAGTVLEFSGGLNGKGFVFNNPNASRTCGCGESFSL